MYHDFLDTIGNMASRKIHQCRVCGSKKLISILNLGELAISDFVLDTKKQKTYPLLLVLCDPKTGCGLLQLGHTGVNQDTLYKKYWYKSGVNESMKRALKDVARDCQRRIKLKTGDVVMDIGANDGTLLSFFPQSLTRVGIEPALNLQSELATKSSVNVPEYFTKKAYKKAVPNQKAKVITSLAMFYDLEEPISFLSDLQACLDDSGIWVNQMTYLGSMLEKNDYPNICHEHVSYYSLKSFLATLSRSGFRLIDVSENDVNGGSIRTIAVPESSPLQPSEAAKARISALLDEEAQRGLQFVKPYRLFAAKVRTSKRKLRALIQKYLKMKKSVYVYGASTKGNTLLQYCELKFPMISGAFDRNPEKSGTLTVATHIPICAESEMKQRQADVLLVLPWHFRDEFLKREARFLEAGGIMIFPLPTLEIISN